MSLPSGGLLDINIPTDRLYIVCIVHIRVRPRTRRHLLDRPNDSVGTVFARSTRRSDRDREGEENRVSGLIYSLPSLVVAAF